MSQQHRSGIARLAAIIRNDRTTPVVAIVAIVIAIAALVWMSRSRDTARPSAIFHPSTGSITAKHFPARTGVNLSITAGSTTSLQYIASDKNGEFTVDTALPSTFAGPITVTATATDPGATSATYKSGPTDLVSDPDGRLAASLADPAEWRLAYADGFTHEATRGRFLERYPFWEAYQNGWRDTTKKGLYDPEILSVNNGVLTMHLHTPSDGVPRVAAPVPRVTGNSIDQLYGRYEVRFRADPIKGYKTAWLLWPQSDKWADGEIDFPEGDLTKTIDAFNHYTGDPRKQDSFNTTARFDDWHVATTEWRPGSVTFYLDGKLVGTSTTNVSTTPMHWVLQTETSITESTPKDQAGVVQVDYVKVWRHTG